MILVHEWGHFVAAKMFGVRVEVFSIGFGKRLVGFRRGDTDYRISALPFGGYVKMSGENPMDQRAGEPEEFMSHPRWQRIVIALAGPFMNIALAVGLLTWVYMVHYEHPLYLISPPWWAGLAQAVRLKRREFSPATRSSRSARPRIPIGSTFFPRS